MGYTILEGGNLRIADASIKRFKDKVRRIAKRNRGVKFDQLIGDLNSIIRGWTNYFTLANKWLSTFRDMDGWLRRKLRCYRLKQCGKKYAIYKFLRSLDISKNTSWNVVMFSGGWWKMSNKVAVSQGMGINWFNKLGLLSIQKLLVG